MNQWAVIRQDDAFRVIEAADYDKLKDISTLMIYTNGEMSEAGKDVMVNGQKHIISAFKTAALERENRDLKGQLEMYENWVCDCDGCNDVAEDCDTAEEGPSLEDRVAVLEQAIIDLTAAPYVPPHYPGTCPGIPQQYPTYPNTPWISYR